MERTIYKDWMLSDDADEEYEINNQIYEELKERYSLKIYSQNLSKEEKEDIMHNYDVVCACVYGNSYNTYYILKYPSDITLDELALLLSNAYLLGLGYSGDFSMIKIYTD
nr:MAG TPA: hypothetical protein [Caudoviricetes sp.]